MNRITEIATARWALVCAMALILISGILVDAQVTSAASSGRITGFVTSAAGSPLRGICADLYTLGGTLGTDARACTNGQGFYSLTVATAGSFDVQFSDPAGIYVTEWYDNQPTQATARPVDVKAGRTTRGVNAAMSKVLGAPAVSGLSPASGPTTGGTSVTISGTNLAGASAVRFGTAAATITSSSATQIVATAPGGAAGTVDVTVTTPGGTSPTSPADGFSYVLGAPAVSGLSPASGPTTGGTSVTISGTNLAGASAVRFGTAAATITSSSATQIVATAPGGAAGTVDVTVTTPGGTSPTSPADGFSYVLGAPAVSGLSPASGPTTGGTSVTISGTNLAGASAVRFGTAAATITSSSATQIVATAPGGAAGTVDVTVTTPGGTSPTSPADGFSYVLGAPAVSGLSPASGPTTGGTSVTISGTNLAGASAVRFGTAAATITSSSATQIVATAPGGAAGTVDVTVTTPGGTSPTSPADGFSYVLGAPAVSGLSPASGPTTGGTSVTISGTNLAGASAVRFGTAAATITSSSATQIVATAPGGAAGTVDVTVTTPGGTSPTSPADGFSYVLGAPAVSGLSPASGPTTGGTSVTISGTNLAGASAVRFGTAAATITSSSATQIVATAPGGAAGTVDVTVTTPGGTSPTSPADGFSYVLGAPAVSGLSPASGPTTGGTSVTISGTNLAGASAVRFGTAAATITSSSATQIVATAPGGAAGTVDVTVTTPGGTSPTSPADGFSYVLGAPVTITRVGSLVVHTYQPSRQQEAVSVSPVAAGDLLAMAIETKFPAGVTSFVASSVSGGGVATWHKAASSLTLDAVHGQELWWGVVATPGPSTITVTYTAGSTSGNSESATSLDVQEFQSSAGAAAVWSLDVTGIVDTGASTTSPSYPTLTPASANEVYFGYLAVPGSVGSGSTPGVVYQVDARGNQCVFNTSVSTSITPIASSGSQTFFSIGMLLKALGP